MEKYRNLMLIGSSHIARESVKEVRKTIINDNPNMVALELDIKRAQALLMRQKPKGRIKFSYIRRVGVQGFLFLLIASFVQRKLGKLVRVEPGEEMRTALLLAREHKKEVVLIDQDIDITLRKLTLAIKQTGKWKLFSDLVKGLISPKRELQKYGMAKFDLSAVPSKTVIRMLIKQFKKNYPKIYRALVSERNEIMANNLIRLMEDNFDKEILAIVGAGHESDMLEIIRDYFEHGPKISYSFKAPGMSPKQG